MRSFLGSRGGNDASRKKGLAGAQYKQKLLGKSASIEPTADEKYRKVLDKKMSEIMGEVAAGRKKAFQLPGTVQEDKKEVSKNFKALMEQLAMKKMQKEADQQKKKERALYFKARAQKRSAEQAVQAEENTKIALRKQEEDRARQQQGAGAYFFGPVEDEKKWWW